MNLYIMETRIAVKIGISTNVCQRIKNVSNGCPLDILRVAVYDIDNAAWYEKVIHKALSDRRLRLEWFWMNFDEAVEIVSDIVKRQPSIFVSNAIYNHNELNYLQTRLIQTVTIEHERQYNQIVSQYQDEKKKVDDLRSDIAQLQEKYDSDIAQLQENEVYYRHIKEKFTHLKEVLERQMTTNAELIGHNRDLQNEVYLLSNALKESKTTEIDVNVGVIHKFVTWFRLMFKSKD